MMHPLTCVAGDSLHSSDMGVEADDTSFGQSVNHASVENTIYSEHERKKQSSCSSKRGRPRADVITSLILKGSASKGKIRCDICSRIFPREKSLQAHMRTHTGERPYACDFPGCRKAFCQSGQLRTHQRLHTGEKPFACSAEGCCSRFTHANRHCSDHPYAGLRRVKTEVTGPDRYWDYADHSAISTWLQKQAEQKDYRSHSKAKQRHRKSKRKHSAEYSTEDTTSDDDAISSSQSSKTSQDSSADDVREAAPLPVEEDDRDKWISALALIELAGGLPSS